MWRNSNSVKVGLQRLTASIGDRPNFLIVIALNDTAQPNQHFNVEFTSSSGTALQPSFSQGSHIKRTFSTTREGWLHHGAGLSDWTSRSVRIDPPIRHSATHEKLFSTSTSRIIDGSVGAPRLDGLNALLVNTRIEHLELERANWCIRKFSRSHMSHAHHEHDHELRDDSGDAGERVSRLGLIADACLCVGKGFSGYLSGSTAVIADAAHSLSDVVLSGVALWIFKAARAPKDEKHPYGHGKFETLGALGISSMLLLTGGGIAWHALEVLQGLLSATDGTSFTSIMQHGADHVHSSGHVHSHGGHQHGIDMEHKTIALCATLISICVKEGLYWITKRVGDARGSELLKANAWHHRSDAISSVIALLGVGGAILGWAFLDPLAGLVVSGMIIRAGLVTGYRSLQELVDSAVPDSVLSPFKETVMKVKGVEGCHELRGRRAGSSIHLDVHIEVDPWLSVSAGHMIGETVREQLRRDHPLLEDTFIHIDPADALSTSNIPRNNVSNDFMERAKSNREVKTDSLQQEEVEKAVRKLVESDFAQVMTFERARCHFLQGRLLVELELSMDPNILIRDAMQNAQTVETKILETLPKISAVETQLKLSNHV